MSGIPVAAQRACYCRANVLCLSHAGNCAIGIHTLCGFLVGSEHQSEMQGFARQLFFQVTFSSAWERRLLIWDP